MCQEERVLTQSLALALAFPIAACTSFADGLAATQTNRNHLRATSREGSDDWKLSLPSRFQGAPWRNDEIFA